MSMLTDNSLPDESGVAETFALPVAHAECDTLGALSGPTLKRAHFDLLPHPFSPGCEERGNSQHLLSLCFRMVALMGFYSYFHMLSEQ